MVAGERLTAEDGLRLWRTPDIWTVCRLADRVRRRLHGDIAYYNVNRHLNYSNVCALSCSFCSFFRKKDEELLKKLRHRVHLGDITSALATVWPKWSKVAAFSVSPR